MKPTAPNWAMTAAGPQDLVRAQEAQHKGVLQIQWPDLKALRTWARQQGWPAPRFGFQDAFILKMLASPETFALAIERSGVALSIPVGAVTISSEKIGKLDALYEERSPQGRPTGWGTLVEELREIRRAVEAGVAVTIDDGPTLTSWQEFYAWAHGRYHMLEDGYDAWIGDDG